MGTWGPEIKNNDAFADIYQEFFELYNKGMQPDSITKKIQTEYQEILEIKEEKNSFFFALAMAQWETKSLDQETLMQVENIITSDEDLKTWRELGANEIFIAKRKIALDKFLKKIKSEKQNAKPRKKIKSKTPIYKKGSCITFRISNGNYGGAIVLAEDTRPETGYNLIATTRINKATKPTIHDFENTDVLICNFGAWQDKVDVNWIAPDLFFKNFSDAYELIGEISVHKHYDINNYEGKGYLFKPMFTSGWKMKSTFDEQLKSEKIKEQPSITISIAQLIEA